MSLPTQTRDNSKLGIALMLLAILMFSLNDVLGKHLVASYSVGLLLLIRSAAGLVILAPFIFKAGWRCLFDISRPKLMLARVCLTALEIFCFYYAVGYMPLADTMTFWMAAPIYVAALSPLLLGERVGWRRWTAILIGFVGVLIALRPSSETLTLPALVAILGSVSFSFMMITGRALRKSSDVAMVFWPNFGVTLLGFAALPWANTMPTPIDFLLLSLLGIFALGAHFLTNRSLVLADAATVTPYQYTLLVWATIFGWLVFNETPRITTIIGAVVIVVSGLFIFVREQKLGIERDTAAEVI